MRLTHTARTALQDLHTNAKDQISMATVARLWNAAARRRAGARRMAPAFESHSAGVRGLVLEVAEGARAEVLEVEQTFHATLWHLLSRIDQAAENLDVLNLNPGTRRWLASELITLAQIIEDGLEGRADG